MTFNGIAIEEGSFEEHGIEDMAKLSVQERNLWIRLRDISHATSDLHEALISRDFDVAHRALDNGANPTAVYRWRDPRRSFLDGAGGERRDLGDLEEMQCPALCLALGARDRVETECGLPRVRRTRRWMTNQDCYSWWSACLSLVLTPMIAETKLMTRAQVGILAIITS